MKRYKAALSVIALVGVTFLSSASGKAQTAPVAGTGVISGKIALNGAPPEMPLLKREADPACAKVKMKDEEVIVGKDGGLQNAVVRIVKGAPPAATPPPEPVLPVLPVLIDQKDCMYRPRVVGLVAGQKVLIRNSDPVLHNVHSFFGTTTGFNRAQMKSSKDIETTFPAGVTHLKCDVHPWMSGWVVANENRFVTVTGETGEFRFGEVPVGTYTLEVWHERYKTKSQEVTVHANQTTPANFEFGP